jgi:hypothetical protein
MIDSQALLRDLKRMVRDLEKDLREAHAESPQGRAIKAEWEKAHDAGRTAHSLETFREDAFTQAAVHWVLACVFLRFIEDNGLVDRAWLAGPGDRLALARDRRADYFHRNPRHADVDYLLACFEEAAALPGLAGLFDPEHNPLFRLPVSGDGAMKLLGFFQKVDPDTGTLVHDFTDAAWNTRFLGDLYQDLSEAARKRYALLQTPEFVERFILERTLDPAIREFGLKEVRLIDPACGSGHFLLGAFERLNGLWLEREPGLNPRAAAQRALDAVAGVDINPFAAEIARFRLLLVALKASDIPRLRDAPAFKIRVAVGDGLLHGVRFGRLDLGDEENPDNRLARLRAHRYASEDNGALTQILSKPYHAVVANPPYITPKDRAENDAYRALYSSCHRKYALTVPFIERCYDLAIDNRTNPHAGGFVGLIVSNSFMKRELGKKLIENFLPSVDLTHVVDMSGIPLPGHGTPTVILLGRNRAPIENTVRTVMGITGEEPTPSDLGLGRVWTAIRSQIDEPGSESEYVSVADTPRDTFGKHPWSIGGGGATELKELIEQANSTTLGSCVTEIGFGCIISEEEPFICEDKRAPSLPERFVRSLVIGDAVRDWAIQHEHPIIFPYDEQIRLVDEHNVKAALWRWRTTLYARRDFGDQNYKQIGRSYWEYHQIPAERNRQRLSITVAFVATHNHFVLDRGGKVFKQSAPVIKLPAGTTEKDHFALLGLLNSSPACFWMKQMFMDRGGGGVGGGLAAESWERFYEHDGTKIKSVPLAKPYPVDLARDLDRLGNELRVSLPKAVAVRQAPSRDILDAAQTAAEAIRARMIALQEELDWRCYRLYGLIEDDLEHADPPALALGERAFEIVMARRMAVGELETAWFERHRSTPITDLPAHWPADYRDLVERRIALIESHRWIGLVERPEYKRRWLSMPWPDQEKSALKEWLLDRLEDKRLWAGEPTLLSTNRLADLAARDADFRQVAELYAGRPDIDLNQLVRELVLTESVPHLSALRYTESGLRKRKEWESTWEKQRREDAIDAEEEARRPVFEGIAKDLLREQIERNEARRRGESKQAYAERIEALLATEGMREAIARKTDSLVEEAQDERKAREVGPIPAPPKYKTADFQDTTYWRLRGGLDVPKERFVLYPGAQREADGSPVITWAGFDHIQQARALATYYIQCKEREGWSEERLKPLLAGLIELLPWLLQWHNAYDPDFGMGLGDYFKSFVADEARALDTTPEALAGWAPTATAAGRAARATGRGTGRRNGRRRGETAE